MASTMRAVEKVTVGLVAGGVQLIGVRVMRVLWEGHLKAARLLLGRTVLVLVEEVMPAAARLSTDAQRALHPSQAVVLCGCIALP